MTFGSFINRFDLIFQNPLALGEIVFLFTCLLNFKFNSSTIVYGSMKDELYEWRLTPLELSNLVVSFCYLFPF